MVADVLTGFKDALRASNTQRSKSIPKKLLLSKDMCATMESLINGGGFTTHCFDYTSKQQDAVHCLFSWSPPPTLVQQYLPVPLESLHSDTDLLNCTVHTAIVICRFCGYRSHNGFGRCSDLGDAAILGDAAVSVGTVVLGGAAVWLAQRFWWEQRFGLHS
ncbi:hypothetical protein CPB85DRAFT_1458576, partial [Mucidula mucida]